jgi:hypothetical protein
MKESFQLFERAAAKGHEESVWIVSVMKDVNMQDREALKEAFAKAEEPLGWYFAGKLSEWESREAFDFFKKSAEGGCSWGQVWYGQCFRYWSAFVETDEKAHVEWLEKAANQNNPWAMNKLGYWFRWEGGDKEKAVSYYRSGVELGWKDSMRWLAAMLRRGEGCMKDLRQAVIWSAKSCDPDQFWEFLDLVEREFEKKSEDSNRLCYVMGWGLYWHLYGTWHWNKEIHSNNDSEAEIDESDHYEEKCVRNKELKSFGTQCLDYYCSCVELQQKSIFMFLLCWNRTTGIKGPGQMIAQMVWEAREDNMVKTMQESDDCPDGVGTKRG